jgi:uncharacterized damage-inducible protein DinB
MASKIITNVFLEEFRREITASRNCLQNLTSESLSFKPHETSMEMKYVALLVAEIPLWINFMIEKGELDFATYAQFKFETAAQLLEHFEQNIKKAEAAFEKADDNALENTFSLKRDGKILYSSPLKIDIPTTLNHWVHHRGQLTVYMRMKEIKVPSIYGPSGDDKNF